MPSERTALSPRTSPSEAPPCELQGRAAKRSHAPVAVTPPRSVVNRTRCVRFQRVCSYCVSVLVRAAVSFLQSEVVTGQNIKGRGANRSVAEGGSRSNGGMVSSQLYPVYDRLVSRE